MITEAQYNDLIRQIADLQYRLDNLVKPERGLQLTLADLDGDGDMDPLTSGTWDGDSFSTSTGTIDWNALYGVPDNATAVWLFVMARDSGSAGAATQGCRIRLYATNTATNPWLQLNLAGEPSDFWRTTHGPVAIAADGTSYYSITATGAGLMEVYIRVLSWEI